METNELIERALRIAFEYKASVCENKDWRSCSCPMYEKCNQSYGGCTILWELARRSQQKENPA